MLLHNSFAKSVHIWLVAIKRFPDSGSFFKKKDRGLHLLPQSSQVHKISAVLQAPEEFTQNETGSLKRWNFMWDIV